jgi:hypothetical protein
VSRLDWRHTHRPADNATDWAKEPGGGLGPVPDCGAEDCELAAGHPGDHWTMADEIAAYGPLDDLPLRAEYTAPDWRAIADRAWPCPAEREGQ